MSLNRWSKHAMLLGVMLTALTGLCLANEPTTIILVRHAEKQTGVGRDPDLTEAGHARAQALAHFVGADVDAIYVTPWRRTLRTAEPLVRAVGLTPIEREPADFDGWVKALRSHGPGETAVVVGHSNTIPRIYGRLIGRTVPDLDDADYDGVFVVFFWSDGRTTGRRFQFGAPTD